MLGFSPLASAPLADDGAVVVNVSLTADSITTGAPKVGELFYTDDYSATASGLFDSISSTSDTIYSDNRGWNTNLSPVQGTVCQAPYMVSHLSVNSTGISFRFSGVQLKQDVNGNWSSSGTGYFFTDLTLYWSGTTVIAANDVSLTSSVPWQATGSGTAYNINNQLASLNSAINAAAATAGVSSNLYDWIPSEVTVTESSDVFRARLAGSSTDLDTYSFTQNSSTVYVYDHHVLADRFLILKQYPNQNDSNFNDLSASANPDTVLEVARFTRSVQQQSAYGASLSENYNLTPTDVISAAPTVDAPSISHDYSLTATEITVATPSVDASTLNQDGVFTGVEITAGAPTVDASTITQVHDLTALEITSGAPVIDAPTITGVNALTASEITAGAPSVDASSISQVHNIATTEITAGTPTVDASSISQVHNLTSTEITTSAPVVDQSGITQVHGLTLTEITAGAPSIDAATFANENINLTSVDITAGTPTVDAPTISENYNLTPVEITTNAPSIDASSITQVHNITSAEITVGAPVIDTTSLSHDYNLTATEITAGAPLIDSSNLDGAITFSGSITSGTPTVDAATLTQLHNISATEITGSAPQIDTASITQVHNITALEITTSQPIIDAPSAIENVNLIGVDITAGAPVIDQTTLDADNNDELTSTDIDVGAPTIDAPTFGQIHVLGSAGITTGAPQVGPARFLWLLQVVPGAPSDIWTEQVAASNQNVWTDAA